MHSALEPTNFTEKDRVYLYTDRKSILTHVSSVFDITQEEDEAALCLVDFDVRSNRVMTFCKRAAVLHSRGVPLLLLLSGTVKQDDTLTNALLQADGAIALEEKSYLSVESVCRSMKKPLLAWYTIPSYEAVDITEKNISSVLHRSYTHSQARNVAKMKQEWLYGALAHHLIIAGFENDRNEYAPGLRALWTDKETVDMARAQVLSICAFKRSTDAERELLLAAVSLRPIVFAGALPLADALGETVFQPQTTAELDAYLQKAISYPERIRSQLLEGRRKAFALRSAASVYNALAAVGAGSNLIRGRVLCICIAGSMAEGRAQLDWLAKQDYQRKEFLLVSCDDELKALGSVIHPDQLEEELPTLLQKLKCSSFYVLKGKPTGNSKLLTDLMNAFWQYSGVAVTAGECFRHEDMVLAENTVFPTSTCKSINQLLRGEALTIPTLQVETDQLSVSSELLSAVEDREAPLVKKEERPLIKPEDSDYLVVTNVYPTVDTPYANMFTHQRVQAYLRHGKMRVAVFSFAPCPITGTKEYVYDNVCVRCGDHIDLIQLLKKHPVKALLIHFAPAVLLEKVNDNEINCPSIWWLHGAESYPAISRNYCFTNMQEMEKLCLAYHTRNGLVIASLKNPKLGIVPVSQALRSDLERIYGLTLPEERTMVIHNYINTDCYSYKEKTADQRFEIVSVKNYRSHVYAGDLLAQTIEELSHRPCFEKLHFTICGSGPLFEEQTVSLLKYPNVMIRKGFLSPAQLSSLYSRSGIVLIPTRHDTQGVSRDEAMSCGCVPITTRIAAIPEFVDENCGELTAPEDVNGMADAVETLVEDEQRFLRKSKAAAMQVRRLCSFEETCGKEINFIRRFAAQIKGGKA